MFSTIFSWELLTFFFHNTFLVTKVFAKKCENRREIIFHFVIELIQWKFNFTFLSSRMLKESVFFFVHSLFDVHRSTHVCLFNFLLCQSFLFVRLSLHLKPVNSQRTLFPSAPSLLIYTFFPSREKSEEEKKSFYCDDMLHGNGALLTNNINDVKWKMKLGGWNDCDENQPRADSEQTLGVSWCVTWWRIM